MELVYLWVEEYKNIHMQGFNFSPRFKCEFTPVYEDKNLSDKSELKITPKDNSLKDFFGKNINITAIVGENGSGKSSLLSNIPRPQHDGGSMERTRIIYVFKIEDDGEEVIKVMSNFQFKTEPKYNINNLDNLPFEYSTFHQDFLKLDFVNSTSSSITQSRTLNNHLLYKIYKNGKHYIDLRKYKHIINKMIFKYSNIDNIFSFNSKTIQIDKRFANIKILLHEMESSLNPKSKKDDEQNKKNIYEYLSNDFDKLDDKEKFLIYVFLKHYQIDKDAIELIYILFKNPELRIIDLKENIFNYKDSELNMDIFKKFYNLIDNENIANKKLEIKNFPDDLKVIFELEIQNILNIEFYDENHIKFNDLSHGERHVFSLILLTYDKLFEQKNNNKLILLDEPDTTLHPQWQRKLLNTFINTFSKIDNISVHILITSHSPFILSDLPKENIIFLEKGKQVYPFKEKEQTFGANIHTLVSHGFFMKDGLMGEFAKEKIKEIFEYLKEDNELKTIQKENVHDFILMIGEDFLREKLLNMYNLKFSISKEEKIKQLEQELKELKNG